MWRWSILSVGVGFLAAMSEAALGQFGGEDLANPQEYWGPEAIAKRADFRVGYLADWMRRDYDLDEGQYAKLRADLEKLKADEIAYFAKHYDENVRGSINAKEMAGQLRTEAWRALFKQRVDVVNGAPLNNINAGRLAERYCRPEQRARGRAAANGLAGDPFLKYTASFCRRLMLDDAQAATAHSIARELIARREEISRLEPDLSVFASKETELFEDLRNRLDTVPRRDQFKRGPASQPVATRPSDLVPAPLFRFR